MSPTSLQQTLARSPLFADLEPDEIASLADAMELVEAEDGEVFIREGERADGFYLVVRGQVAVHAEHEGARRDLRTLEPGEVFGLVSLIDHGRRSATCEAVGPATVARLSVAAFDLLHEGSDRLTLHFRLMVARQLARDVRELDDMLRRALVADAREARVSGDFHL